MDHLVDGESHFPDVRLTSVLVFLHMLLQNCIKLTFLRTPFLILHLLTSAFMSFRICRLFEKTPKQQDDYPLLVNFSIISLLEPPLTLHSFMFFPFFPNFHQTTVRTTANSRIRLLVTR